MLDELSLRDNKKRISGLLIFLIVNGSFIFLLLSPYIPNYFGEYLDDQFLSDIDDRIREVRMDTFEIIILNESTGLPLTNQEIEFELIKHDFIFGCNIYGFNKSSSESKNEDYANYFKGLFNFAVLPFYWASYEPDEGEFPTDEWINFTLNWCEQNNITTKGHPLSWTNPAGVPDWLPDDDEKILDLLKDRMKRIMNKYQDRIHVWDVVNEPVHTPTFGGLSTFDYVETCYDWAHEYDRDAHLTINDYGIIGHDFGYGPFYNLIQQLVQNDVPIDSIGFQAHEPRTDWIPAIEIWNTLEAYSVFGIPIFITEFTPTSAPVPITNSWKKGLWSEENQAEYAEKFYKICLAHPNVKGVIWWDLWDGASWLDQGGLINEDMNKKEVYKRIDDLINDEWHSEGSETTNSNGKLDFKGFYGIYNITVPSLGTTVQINAERRGSNKFTIKI